MKHILACLLFSFVTILTFAQNSIRRISFKSIEKDSVAIPLNDEYLMIEDSCAQIIRYARLNLQTRKFYGKFTDVSKVDPNLIVSEGTYSSDGLKNGLFKVYYLNGTLKAKGNFKDDKYDGHWEMFYENGKPELIFDVADGIYNISDAYSANGEKIVDKGNGVYTANLGMLYWKGKLVDGKPDGRWNLIKTDDVSNNALITEHYKKGVFKDGYIGDLNYTNSSRVVLVDIAKLPLVNAEKMRVSTVPCDGVKSKHIVNAQYDGGLNIFSTYISDAVVPYMSRKNFTGITLIINITGEIAENGTIVNLRNAESSNEGISRGLILQLKDLPQLHPATIDGKPVKQGFVISFNISNNKYSFQYRFLPIKLNQ